MERQEKVVRVVFKTNPQSYGNIKDNIWKWKEVSNVQFRKEKKINTTRMEEKERVERVQSLGEVNQN